SALSPPLTSPHFRYTSSFLTLRHHPRPPLFPYTTLFRSVGAPGKQGVNRYVSNLRHGAPTRLTFERPTGVEEEENPFRSVGGPRSEEHTSELQSRENLVCRLLLEKKNKNTVRNKDVKHKQ